MLPYIKQNAIDGKKSNDFQYFFYFSLDNVSVASKILNIAYKMNPIVKLRNKGRKIGDILPNDRLCPF